jgi:hypothetical protein
MKESQWVIAAVVLAALVFVVVFATQYLGTAPQQPGQHTQQSTGRLDFAYKAIPDEYEPEKGKMVKLPPPEYEQGAKGWQDYYFLNSTPSEVKVGLNRTTCKCSAVEVHVVPGDGRKWAGAYAEALFMAGFSEPLAAPLSVLATRAALLAMSHNAEVTELKGRSVSASVPPGAAGWVRLRWNAERAPGTSLEATLWFDHPRGLTSSLHLVALTFDPVIARQAIPLGALSAEELKKGVKFDIFCMSPLRTSFSIEAEVVRRGPASADTLTLGTPRRLSQKELREVIDDLERQVPDPKRPLNSKPPLPLCGYLIPATLSALAPDGKTPLEIGPFTRRVLLRCPDLPGNPEPLAVLITGRARGVVEIGSDEGGGEGSFGEFPRKRGRKITINLSTTEPDLKLTFDRSRTPEYLDAKLPDAPIQVGGRKTWEVRLEVKPGMAVGQFPRQDDPLYEDAAVYFKAEVGKTPHVIRVAVSGTATE